MFFSILLALIALITVFRLRGRQTRLENEVLDLRSRLALLSKQMSACAAFGPEAPTVRAPDPVAPPTDPRLRPSEMWRAGPLWESLPDWGKATPAAAVSELADHAPAEKPDLAPAYEDAPTPALATVQDPEPAPPPAPSVDPAPHAGFEKTGTPPLLDRLVPWLIAHWFYVASAACLALAGVFLVIYGAEQGYLTPAMRLVAAALMGAAFVGAGEGIRRRYGDTQDKVTAYLPSVFSGAGVVTLFGTVLAARHLYGFIGPETALIGLAAVSMLSIGLGWLCSPLLAGVGVLGGMAAPFLIGGSAADPSGLLLYFSAVALVGLAVDALREWRWLSALSAVLGFGAGTLLLLSAPEAVAAPVVPYALALAAMAVLIPGRSVLPTQGGSAVLLTRLIGGPGVPAPGFRTLLAAASVAMGSVLIVLACLLGTLPGAFWTATASLTAMTLALTAASVRAPALSDLAAFPAAGLLFLTATGRALGMYDEVAPTLLLLMGAAVSVAWAWRSLREEDPDARVLFASAAALGAPALGLMLELFWQPIYEMGVRPWAAHALGLSALMVGMAACFSRADGPEDRLLTSIAALSAMTCLAFGLCVVSTQTALTIALGLTMLAAAWADRRFNLPALGLFVVGGVPAVGFRLFVDPGLAVGLYGPMPEMVLAYGGSALLFFLSYREAAAAGREAPRILLDSAAVSAAGVFASLLLYRVFAEIGGVHSARAHWALGTFASVWFLLGFAQVRRTEVGGTLAAVRVVLGSVFIVIGAFWTVAAVTVANPLTDGALTLGPVLGTVLLNSLIPAYLAPGLVLMFGPRWVRAVPEEAGRVLFCSGVALVGLWAVLAIRHAWRGAEGMPLPGMGQGELYTYTVAMMLAGAALFARSLVRGDVPLRRAGLVVLGLTVAKVFFVDIGELTGLTRVFALLFLGLALAGLAWLDRWASNARQLDPEQNTCHPEKALDLEIGDRNER